MGREEDRTTVGVVGCGYWGPNHIRNMLSLEASGTVHMKAAVDPDPARRLRIRDLYPQIEVSDGVAAVFSDPDVDAVVLSTPTGTHFRLAGEALRAGKHVLVEKPLATSIAHCEELIRLAAEHELVLMVGHTFEYTAAVNTIQGLVAEGALGEVLYVRSLRVNLGLHRRDVNVLWDLAPHDISIIRFVLDAEPTHVTASGNANVTAGIEDIVSLNLHFGEKAMANVIVSWLDPRKVREMTFVGTRKMLVYDDVAAAEKIRIFDKGVDRPSEYDSFGEFPFAYRYGDILSPKLDDYEPLREQSSHFIDCIRLGKRPRSDGESGLAVVRALAAAQISLRNDGRKVALADPAVLDVEGSGAPPFAD
jgi:predicted dehydrogenase